MEDLVRINKIMTVNTLETFLEKHPEDTQKWMDHLDPQLHKPENNSHIRRIELSDADYEKYNIDNEQDSPFTDHEIMCGYCRKTWETTSVHPTATLLCGHKYHTLCYSVVRYEAYGDCIVEGCQTSTTEIVREIYNRRMRLNNDLESTLIDAIKHTSEFKEDVKKMKNHLGIISKKYLEANKLIKRSKNRLRNKHVFNLRQIQYDMNAAIKSVRNSNTYLTCKSEIAKYRGIERKFFRKYHITLRDLIRNRIIRLGNWNLRYAIERHGSLLRTYKFGIRIYPGSNKWTTRDEDDSDESDDAGSTVEENELITEQDHNL
jgi:hypothetical protein